MRGSRRTQPHAGCGSCHKIHPALARRLPRASRSAHRLARATAAGFGARERLRRWLGGDGGDGEGRRLHRLRCLQVVPELVSCHAPPPHCLRAWQMCSQRGAARLKPQPRYTPTCMCRAARSSGLGADPSCCASCLPTLPTLLNLGFVGGTAAAAGGRTEDGAGGSGALTTGADTLTLNAPGRLSRSMRPL